MVRKKEKTPFRPSWKLVISIGLMLIPIFWVLDVFMEDKEMFATSTILRTIFKSMIIVPMLYWVPRWIYREPKEETKTSQSKKR